jgi:hypothetical protein
MGTHHAPKVKVSCQEGSRCDKIEGEMLIVDPTKFRPITSETSDSNFLVIRHEDDKIFCVFPCFHQETINHHCLIVPLVSLVVKGLSVN